MAEEELIDFGFSAVTADEYERDNTDGEKMYITGWFTGAKIDNFPNP